VVLIHEGQLAKYGGAAGIRDRGLLESAVAMPRASFGGELAHADLFNLAAAYAFHIAENQPSHDGNKRTGVLAAVVFLELNGIIVEESPLRLYEAMIAIAERRLDKGGLAAILQEMSRPATGAREQQESGESRPVTQVVLQADVIGGVEPRRSDPSTRNAARAEACAPGPRRAARPRSSPAVCRAPDET